MRGYEPWDSVIVGCAAVSALDAQVGMKLQLLTKFD
jgi:hypothetical protein